MILWGKEHQDRAEALAKTNKERAIDIHSLQKEPAGKGIQSIRCPDSTLTIWGHGDAKTFCELSNAEFGVLLKNWKKLNPELKIVEIVTCNARHNADPFSSYAVTVAKFVRETYPDVAIRALPIGQNRNDHSILYANAVTGTFCYITAGSQEAFDEAIRLFEDADRKNNGNCNVAGQEIVKFRGTTHPPFTINSGKFEDLRASLVNIHP